jgi:hypothetical protein
MKAILLFIAVVLSVGCGTTSTSQSTRIVDTSNLKKTEYGTYRIIPMTLESKIKNGLSLSDKEVVTSKDLAEVPALMSPKQQSLAKDSSLPPNKENSTQKIIPITIEDHQLPLEKSSVRIDWTALFAFYFLAAWALMASYFFFKIVKTQMKNLENPFKEPKKDESPPKSE